MPAAKSGGGKKPKDPGKLQGAMAALAAGGGAADQFKLKEQHGQLSSENHELKSLRSQLLAKEKAMREKIDKLRQIAMMQGKSLGIAPPPALMNPLEPPKLKHGFEQKFSSMNVSSPHTPLKPFISRKKSKNGKSPRKYKPMKIPVKIPKIKPSGDPELDKLRREAAVLEAQNAVLTRQRSGLRRGVKELATDRNSLSQQHKRIRLGYSGKRKNFQNILHKHKKYAMKDQKLKQKTSSRIKELEREYKARGLDFPGSPRSPRREKSPRPRAKLQRSQRARHDKNILRGRMRGNGKLPGGSYPRPRGDGMDMRRFDLKPTTPKRTNLHKLRAPRRNRSKSLPRAHTQSYLRRHTRANLSKNSYSRSRRMSRQRDRPNDLDVPRRKSISQAGGKLSQGKSTASFWPRNTPKAVDDDIVIRESRRRRLKGGLGDVPTLEAYSSLPDLRASSERNYRNGDDGPLSKVMEEGGRKSKGVDTKSRVTQYSKLTEVDSTMRLVSALKELSPNAAAIVQRRAGKLQHRRKNMKTRRKSIQRQKKKGRKQGSKTALSSIPTEAARKENSRMTYSQSLNNLGLTDRDRVYGRGARSMKGRDTLDARTVKTTPYSAKDFDMKWSGKFQDLERQFQASLKRAKGTNGRRFTLGYSRERPSRAVMGMGFQRSASQQRVRDLGKDHIERRHSLGAFDFESLYTRKSPRQRKRNMNKERSKSVDHGRQQEIERQQRDRPPERNGTSKMRSKSSEGFRNMGLGTFKIKNYKKNRDGRDPLDEAMSDFRKLTPENFENKYKKLHHRHKQGLLNDEEKPRYDDFVRSLKDGTRMATSKQSSMYVSRGDHKGSPEAMPSYKRRNNDWWARMNNLKIGLRSLDTFST